MNKLHHTNDKESRFHLISIPHTSKKDEVHPVSSTNFYYTILELLKKLTPYRGKFIPANEGVWLQQVINEDESHKSNVEAMVEYIMKIKEQVPLPSSCIPPLPTMTLPSCRASATLPILLNESGSLSLEVMRAIKKRHSSFGIIQFGAHANLDARDNRHEESSSMRTVIEELGVSLFQIGVRGLTEEEKTYRKEIKALSLDAPTLRCPKPWSNTSRKKSSGRPIPPLLPAHFPELIYLTFSVDAFDSSIMPATKNPEPGGLFWWDALHLIERSMAGRVLLGFDVIGFTPIPHFRAYDHTVAKLVHEIMSLIEPVTK